MLAAPSRTLVLTRSWPNGECLTAVSRIMRTTPGGFCAYVTLLSATSLQILTEFPGYQRMIRDKRFHPTHEGFRRKAARRTFISFRIHGVLRIFLAGRLVGGTIQTDLRRFHFPISLDSVLATTIRAALCLFVWPPTPRGRTRCGCLADVHTWLVRETKH